MLKASFSHAKEDAEARALNEERVEASRLIEAVEAALKKDGDILLTADTRHEIRAAIDVLRRELDGADHRVIKEGIAELSRTTEDFAAMRMDKSVATALKGKKIDDAFNENAKIS